ncbi:MAG: hypothetical protein R2932_10475 [Caldilineaceae bacterium]
MSNFAFFFLVLLALTGPLLWLIRPHRFWFAGWIAAIPAASPVGN